MAGAVRKRLVELYFDVLSPYSYVSFTLFDRCSRRWGTMDLDLKPVVIGGIFKAAGIIPAALDKDSSRAKYMWVDLDRITRFYNVPFTLPKDVHKVLFEKNSLSAQRLLTATKQEHPEQFVDLANEIYARIWQRDLDITEESSLTEACAAAGISAERSEALLERVKQSEVKDALKKSTTKATEDGVFGLPSYVLHLDDGQKEVFFGTDRMFLLADRLGEHWPVAKP